MLSRVFHGLRSIAPRSLLRPLFGDPPELVGSDHAGNKYFRRFEKAEEEKEIGDEGENRYTSGDAPRWTSTAGKIPHEQQPDGAQVKVNQQTYPPRSGQQDALTSHHPRMVEKRWWESSHGRLAASDYVPEGIPVEWESWLRFTRAEPPSEGEVERMERYRREVAMKAQAIEKLQSKKETGKPKQKPKPKDNGMQSIMGIVSGGDSGGT